MENKLNLKIISPQRVICETLADNAGFPGEQGLFSVYPMHAPLISSLVQGEITYTASGKRQSVRIKSGFVKVLDDNVTACVETD